MLLTSKLRMDLQVRSMAAAAVGAGVGFLAFIFQHINARNEREDLYRQLNDLKRDVTDLRQEIATIRTSTIDVARKTSGDFRQIGRRRRKVRILEPDCAGYDTDGTSTMYSAMDTDDDMFYDISSEDDCDSQLKSKQAENMTDVLVEANKLFSGNDADKKNALSMLQKQLESSPDDPKLLWMVAKGYKFQADVAAAAKNKELQLELINIGLKYAEKSVELNPDDGEAHMWLAIMLGLRSDFLPITEKLSNGVIFRNHLSQAIEKLPGNRVLHHMSASFKFAIANLSWFERKAAKLLGDVPDYTMADVITDAIQAEELAKEPWPENKLLLAKAYLAKQEYEAAFQFIDSAKDASIQQQNVVTELEANELATKYSKYR